MHVLCSNTDFLYINKVAYEKKTHTKNRDMPSVSVNTKLGTDKSFAFMVYRVYSVLYVFSDASPYIG